jgi:arsenate reductase (glutaredoxin)
MSITIFHNPRCSTSRRTLELLKKNGVSPVIRLYLDEPPAAKELKEVLGRLGMEAKDLLRTKEEIYKNLEGKEGKPDNTKALAWMIKYPILIERPIVIKGKKARLGRPPETVLEIL